MAKIKQDKDKEVLKSSSVLGSFLKQNSEDHYNFEDEIFVRDNYPWKKRDKTSEMILM